MARARDTQRQKLYNAENFLQRRGPRYETVEEMQAYVDRVLKSAWFRRRWPRVAGGSIEVRDGRGRSRACASTDWAQRIIKMPKWARAESVILHEITHHCADEAHGVRDVAAHGWEYASTLLELVTHEMGAEAGKDLKESYKAKRVRHKAPRQRKPLTAEQREILVERMAVVRAAQAAKVDLVKV